MHLQTTLVRWQGQSGSLPVLLEISVDSQEMLLFSGTLQVFQQLQLDPPDIDKSYNCHV